MVGCRQVCTNLLIYSKLQGIEIVCRSYACIFFFSKHFIEIQQGAMRIAPLPKLYYIITYIVNTISDATTNNKYYE